MAFFIRAGLEPAPTYKATNEGKGKMQKINLEENEEKFKVEEGLQHHAHFSKDLNQIRQWKV